jgi:hypothetical protein
MQQERRRVKGPSREGPLDDWTWQVPNDEVVVIAARYPKTESQSQTPGMVFGGSSIERDGRNNN